jgi:hypothetical protein
MRIHTFIFALAIALACGCATEHFTKSHGDVGQFILQQAISYGGSPTTTNGLPVVASHWRYLEDAHGMQIHLPSKAYPDVEAFLNQAFAGVRQFGPTGSAEDRTRFHEYRMSAKGGGIQLAEQDSETVVIVLRPFGASK